MPVEVGVHVQAELGCHQGVAPVLLSFADFAIEPLELSARELEDGEPDALKFDRAALGTERQIICTVVFQQGAGVVAVFGVEDAFESLEGRWTQRDHDD